MQPVAERTDSLRRSNCCRGGRQALSRASGNGRHGRASKARAQNEAWSEACGRGNVDAPRPCLLLVACAVPRCGGSSQPQGRQDTRDHHRRRPSISTQPAPPRDPAFLGIQRLFCCSSRPGPSLGCMRSCCRSALRSFARSGPMTAAKPGQRADRACVPHARAVALVQSGIHSGWKLMASSGAYARKRES